ncbi:MAG: YqeG family HAD IIIA-type phosphatase [Candidatus Izimaplasma sp.]|nr:YqeG family HAD IIIA-type phosphatase [Candidatus Izimaplasma bacterium]
MLEIFLKKKYFYPNQYKKTIYEIDFSYLKEQGIEYIFIDLDNTLISYDENHPSKEIKNLINKIKDLNLKVVIISNNKKTRVKSFSDNINCDYIFSAKKPFRSGFKRALKLLGNPNPEKVCLIGDQFLTDVLGGKKMGFYVIVVDAIKRKSEKWYTKLNRRLEKKVLNRLKKTDRQFYDKLHLEEKR